MLVVQELYQERPPLPFSPGMEVSGVVEALGAGVAGFHRGDRVAALGGHGGPAEEVLAPAAGTVHIADGH